MEIRTKLNMCLRKKSCLLASQDLIKSYRCFLYNLIQLHQSNQTAFNRNPIKFHNPTKKITTRKRNRKMCQGFCSFSVFPGIPTSTGTVSGWHFEVKVCSDQQRPLRSKVMPFNSHATWQPLSQKKHISTLRQQWNLKDSVWED